MEVHILRLFRHQAHTLVLCTALFWLRFAALKAEQVLSGHAIGAPPNINDLNEQWFLAGTVIPSQRSLVLQPGVPNRLGLLWSKFPLLTNDFEVKFTFTVRSPAKLTTKEEGFAFWYVHENVSAVQENISTEHLHNQDEIISNGWASFFAQDGFDLFGYRSAYEGYAVFFYDPNGKRESPQLLSKVNDGKTAIRYNDLQLAPDVVKQNFRTGSEVKVRIRVQPSTAKVEIDGGESQEVKGEFKPGGYLGFSIFGGQKGAVEPTERCDCVELYSLEVINHDKASKGEDVPTATGDRRRQAPPKAKEEKEDILHEASSFKDHRAESEAIKELTNMVFKLVVESQPLRNQMTNAIESLSRRVTIMENTFEQLKVELDKKTGHKLGEEFDAIKKELSSLANVASTETEERHKRLDSLHEDVADVHKKATSGDTAFDHHLTKLTESNQRTLDSLNTEHQKMFGVSLAAIAFILVAGLSLYCKFSRWDKKHIL